MLLDPPEIELYNNLSIVTEIEELIDKKDYDFALDKFDSITDSINSFLDNIMVMVDDKNIRNNRLAILGRIYSVVTRLFIPSVIVKEK